jgi:hypothetical protein
VRFVSSELPRGNADPPDDRINADSGDWIADFGDDADCRGFFLKGESHDR